MLSGAASTSDRPGPGEPSAVESDDGARERTGAGAPHNAILVAIFTVVSIGMTFPNITRLRTYVAGGAGDSFLNLWIMRRVQIGLPHGWHAFWNAPIFHPAPATLAYSDTLFPAALVHWPLRVVFGDVLALNLIYIGSWVLASWCVYRIALRYVRHWGAAVVAALAYTYSAPRLTHHVHLQLVVGGALVPLVLLLLLRLFDAPTPRRGLLLGASFAALTLSASYFGAMMAVVVVIVTAALFLVRRPAVRPFLVAFGAAAAVVVACVGPFGIKYAQLQQHAEFRRLFEPATATHMGDFAATGTHNYLLEHVPFIASASRSNSRGIENRLFPGLVALGFGAVGAAALAAALRARRRDRRLQELLPLALAGVLAALLSVGDFVHVGNTKIHFPFAVFRRFVPGFAGIRAVARLEVAFELALVLFAAVGVDVLVRRVPARRRTPVALGVAALVLAECAIALTFVRVPTAADDGGVVAALRARPAGVVLELPILAADRGSIWASTEAPRQLLALRDQDPRVNGYSGFQPKDFDTEVAELNTFPSAPALALAHGLGVRYVVLRTQLIPSAATTPSAPYTKEERLSFYEPDAAARLVTRIPAGVPSATTKLAGGYLVDLGA